MKEGTYRKKEGRKEGRNIRKTKRKGHTEGRKEKCIIPGHRIPNPTGEFPSCANACETYALSSLKGRKEGRRKEGRKAG